ncbi:MAG: putative HTH transcriptional regulator [Candidatus Paceibacteria bacterium]|jgi:predicted HTH transcriptional regulator
MDLFGAYASPVNLSEAELIELVAQGEGRGLEFKRGLPRDEKLARTLCAFANTRGGWLLVGINDNGSLHLCPRPREVLDDVRRVAAGFLLPPVPVQTTTVKCSTGTIVAVHVHVSLERPHCVIHCEREREVVVRVGSSNREAKGATLSALRSQPSSSRPRDPLEARILEWVKQRVELANDPGGDATPAAFGEASNIGKQRARRAFVRLERDGLLVAHGTAKNKFYGLP